MYNVFMQSNLELYLQIEPILAHLRCELEALYGSRLKKLILYGSQARGDAVSGSDIDVMVVLDGLVDPYDEIMRTGEITSALSLQYNVVISCVYVSAERYQKEQSPLLLNIQREGVLV